MRKSLRIYLIIFILLLLSGMGFFIYKGIIQWDNKWISIPAYYMRVMNNKTGADMVIDNFHFIQTEGEKVIWEVKAKKAEVSRSDNKATLWDLQAIFHSPQDVVITAIGDEGLIEMDESEVFIKKSKRDVYLTSTKGFTLITENLKWVGKKKIISTDALFEVIAPTFNLKGKGFVFKIEPQEVEVFKNVSVSVQH